MNNEIDTREPYEPPAVVYEDVLEALAAACADCDTGTTKSNGGTCALTGSTCASPFSS